MHDLSAFPITHKWPAQHPDRIQLYSLPTPNGVKASIMLVETGQPLALFESGAILVYLADKSGRFMPKDPAARYHTLQWLMWQMGGLGPMFGQLGFFNKFAGKDWEDKRPLDRYVAESKRLLDVLEQRLTGRNWIMGQEYTVADIATFPWVRNLVGFYEAGALVGFDQFPQVQRALAAFVERPAVQRGLAIPARD